MVNTSRLKPVLTNSDPEALHALLVARLGHAHYAQRCHLQAHYVADMIGHGLTLFHIENMRWAHWLIERALKMTGLYGRGQRNALAVRVRRNRIIIPGLPPGFDGYTVLQLSDLHLDINKKLVDAIARVVRPLAYDVCVMTGDFRAKTYGEIEVALSELARLRPFLRSDVYGVMGNHDFIEMLPAMEAMDIRFLMNEHVMLRRGADVICLAGVDDPHFYETDNLHKAAGHLEHDVPAILLSHSPEVYRNAAACGFDVMLCGHTHGGQICLPGGIPFMMNARAPLRMSRGAWEYRGLIGYTSVGTGCSGVDVRFWCPPEVTLHTLVSIPDPSAA